MSIPDGPISKLAIRYLAPNSGVSVNDGRPLPHTCPHCGKGGTFMGTHDYSYDVSYSMGGRHLSGVVNTSVRFCPNPECLAPVFLISEGNRVIHSAPTPRIDFDSTRLPKQIADCLDEAIGCHAAGCFRASALLVRRTIEEVCKEKSATGRTLKARIQSLGTVMTLPPALISAMDQLRLLGNDAAHVDASDYDEVGANESAAAIMLAKEIVKAAYQYDHLLEALSKLQRDAAP